MNKKLKGVFFISLISLIFLGGCSSSKSNSELSQSKSSTATSSNSERDLTKYKNLKQTNNGEIFFPANLENKNDSTPLVNLSIKSVKFMGEAIPTIGNTAGKETEVFMVTIDWKWNEYSGKEKPTAVSFADIFDGTSLKTIDTRINDEEASFIPLEGFTEETIRDLKFGGFQDTSTDNIGMNTLKTDTIMIGIAKSKVVADKVSMTIAFHDIKGNSIESNFDLSLTSNEEVTPK